VSGNKLFTRQRLTEVRISGTVNCSHESVQKRGRQTASAT
jgi:hypothetical protein